MSTPSTPHLSRRERRALERRSTASRPRPGPTTVPRSVWRSPLVIVTAAAFLLMAGVLAVLIATSSSGGAPATISIVQPPATGINEYADGEAIGPADAPVVLEVYADYQCPWCGRFARETLPGLVRTYVAAGQLRIEERAIAFLGTGSPDESLDAAAAAACAAPAGKYWTFADYLVWNQSGENERGLQPRPPRRDGEAGRSRTGRVHGVPRRSRRSGGRSRRGRRKPSPQASSRRPHS